MPPIRHHYTTTSSQSHNHPGHPLPHTITPLKRRRSRTARAHQKNLQKATVYFPLPEPRGFAGIGYGNGA